MVTIAVVGFHGSTAVPFRLKAVLNQASSAEPGHDEHAAQRPTAPAAGTDVPGSSASSPKPTASSPAR